MAALAAISALDRKRCFGREAAGLPGKNLGGSPRYRFFFFLHFFFFTTGWTGWLAGGLQVAGRSASWVSSPRPSLSQSASTSALTPSSASLTVKFWAGTLP
jgi:hypothetical protein